ncbi:MAG: ATP-binding cassette domain-containing protein [Alphaproteobacteria bacterium]|nr:ATP-binding cassette domain-containing protein [Alphaproteobacteria bacterium]
MTAPSTILPLEVTDLVYEIDGKRLLHDISFRLSIGSRTVLLGPNGAGKSLTLRLCHGLLTPTMGAIRWGSQISDGKMSGEPAGALARAQRHQAMVFQRPVLLRRSARGNVEHALKLRRVARAQRRARADLALAQTGLAALGDQPARTLSGGEQQRLALARAWATSPQVLFLDEPTANLDPAATRAVETLIDGFHAAGTKIVMTTHDLGQAQRIADEILFLHNGRLLEQTPADQFFTAPQTRAAQAFIKGELLW